MDKVSSSLLHLCEAAQVSNPQRRDIPARRPGEENNKWNRS